ncbi:MAG: hypothetical protein ACREP9_05395 [Candidatus Dormibacteraceae bacterium]
MRHVKAIAVVAVAVGLALGPAGASGQHQRMQGMATGRTASSAKITTQNDTQQHILTIRVGPVSLPGSPGHMTMIEAPNLYLSIPFDG